MGMRMIEAFLTSSVLIVVVLILRRLCRGKISLCLQYGIWLIIAVKLLLVPVPFLESPFSVMNLIGMDTEATLVHQNVGGGAVPGTDANTETTYMTDELAEFEPNKVYLGEERIIGETAHNFEGAEGSRTIIVSTEEDISGRSAGVKKFLGDFLNALPFIVYVNAFLLAAWMLFYNMKIYFKLRSARISYQEDEYGKEAKNPKIYLVEELKTPCLYGMSIYLPIDTPKNEQNLRHILAHETAHYRHKDFIWSFLRLLCTALNWYNPFVWIAAAAEKQDCELACDESAIKALGEEERILYGETLIRLVGEKTPQDVLTISTTMTASAKEIKTRISLIAKKPVTVTHIAVITAIVLVMSVFCTFTGKVEAAGKNQEIIKEEIGDAHSQTDGETQLIDGTNGEAEGEVPAKYDYETIESETAEMEGNGLEADSSEDHTDEIDSNKYTEEELIEEFMQLTEDNTFSIYVRSISRSARQIDLFSMPAEVWNHVEDPSAYGSMAFSEECNFHFYNFNSELGIMEFSDTDFDGFVNEMSLDGIDTVECKVTCKDGLITDIIAYNTYFGITYSGPIESRDYYDLHGIEGYALVGTYMADISEAEGIENIYVYSGNMGDGDGGYVIVEKAGQDDRSGEILWIEEAHIARAGWNNIYLGNMNGKAFLFTLTIDIRGGFGELAYHAFRLDAEGNPLPYNGAKFVYEEETFTTENFQKWFLSMSAYMNQSFLLLSTQDGTLKTCSDTTYGYPESDNYLSDSDSSYVAVPESSGTEIPAPEQGGYEFIELQRMIEKSFF